MPDALADSLPRLDQSLGELSLLENNPRNRCRAQPVAPVSVAKSIMNFGFFLCDVPRAVRQHNRPSVGIDDLDSLSRHRGDNVTRRCALPSGMFSTTPMAPMTLTLARAASACIRPTTQAAPPMSPFMSSSRRTAYRDAAGVKQTPLPMKASAAPRCRRSSA